MVASSNNPADDNWYLDPGASHHLTRNEGNLNNSALYTGTYRVTAGNGKHLSISNTGSHRIVSNSHSLQLRKVFHVSFISANMVNVAKFCSDNNALIEFRSNSFIVKDLHTKKVLAQGRIENGLYRFLVLHRNRKMAYVGVRDLSTFHSHRFNHVHNKVELWHHRLGHAATDIVVQVMQSCNVSCERNKVVVCSTVCPSCQMGKSHRLPAHLSSSRASKPLELIHTDIWGPIMLKSTSSIKYFILFLDDYSRYTWFYPLQTKDQALLVFK
jgi:histone deacetylase 1/2